MAEYRYIGVNQNRQRVTGYIKAKNSKDAKGKIHLLALQHHFSVVNIQPKATFDYVIKKRDGSKIKGNQQAYSREEVELALRKMGFYDVRVQKRIIDFKFKPPQSDIITFIRLSADLLREKLQFDEILSLLEKDINNSAMRRVIREIHTDLKEGKDGEEVFRRQENMLGKFAARMLGVASKSGNMAEVYDNTAKFLERNFEFKKNLKSALLMPSITVFVLFLAVVFYIGYIFPKTAELFEKVGAELPPLTSASLQMSHFLQNNIIWLLLAMFVPIVVAFRFFTTKRGQIIFGKYIIKMPLIGSLIHKMSIEIFCRVFHSMYSGSGENIEVIRTAAEACRNKYMEKQIKEITIPLMIQEGKSFIEGLRRAEVFTENALTRLNTGAESGTLKKTALQVANYYERETSYRMKNIVEMIQVVIAFIIMIVMTALTIVSSETAVVQPKLPGMQ
ncbi:MAG: type II secretion system F family protein [Calditrichaeota bacterium]|nr:type II secretion system F family protein [Calditrichota bacterium]